MTEPKKPDFIAETPRQEGAQGRVGRGPHDTVSNGEVDASDPNNPPIDVNSNNQQKPPAK